MAVASNLSRGPNTALTQSDHSRPPALAPSAPFAPDDVYTPPPAYNEIYPTGAPARFSQGPLALLRDYLAQNAAEYDNKALARWLRANAAAANVIVRFREEGLAAFPAATKVEAQGLPDDVRRDLKSVIKGNKVLRKLRLTNGKGLFSFATEPTPPGILGVTLDAWIERDARNTAPRAVAHVLEMGSTELANIVLQHLVAIPRGASRVSLRDGFEIFAEVTRIDLSPLGDCPAPTVCGVLRPCARLRDVRFPRGAFCGATFHGAIVGGVPADGRWFLEGRETARTTIENLALKRWLNAADVTKVDFVSQLAEQLQTYRFATELDLAGVPGLTTHNLAALLRRSSVRHIAFPSYIWNGATYDGALINGYPSPAGRWALTYKGVPLRAALCGRRTADNSITVQQMFNGAQRVDVLLCSDGSFARLKRAKWWQAGEYRVKLYRP